MDRPGAQANDGTMDLYDHLKLSVISGKDCSVAPSLKNDQGEYLNRVCHE
jgi:hypothetical protein